jgi:hypothetical protein
LKENIAKAKIYQMQNKSMKQTIELFRDAEEIIEYLETKKNDEYYQSRVESMKRRLKSDIIGINQSDISILHDEYPTINYLSKWNNINIFAKNL